MNYDAGKSDGFYSHLPRYLKRNNATQNRYRYLYPDGCLSLEYVYANSQPLHK